MSSEYQLKFGTCSWNYDSWVGSVYTKKQRYSANYLPEYSKKYSTVEIDSWFYRIPTRDEVLLYTGSVDEDFRFTAKVPQIITKPFLSGKFPTEPNPDFLSPELFLSFLKIIEPILSKLSGLIFQFEYLNKQKMSSLEEFIDRTEIFISNLPKDISVAFEIRNSNYLQIKYFAALKNNNIIPVLVERMYMPPINEVYKKYNSYIGEDLIIRLLGGDRKEIESLTKKSWNSIVAPKQNIGNIANLISDIAPMMNVTVNVNNHYEGSGPGSIDRIKNLMAH